MEKITAYTHGMAQGNPGPAAAGIHIVDRNGKMIQEVKQSLGNGNTDFAEYYAVMLTLQTLIQMYEETSRDMQFEIKLSSEAVKKQLNDEAQINSPGLVPMFIEIHNMRVSNFPNLDWTLVSTEKNSKAVALVNEVLGNK